MRIAIVARRFLPDSNSASVLRHSLFVFALVLCFETPCASAQEQVAGTWTGHWIRAGDSLPVTLTIRRDSVRGGYAATFSSERLRVTGIPFDSVSVSGCCEVRMVLRGDRTTATFGGKIVDDSLSGTLSETGSGPGRFAYARAAAEVPRFDEHEISFRSDTVTLAGSLLMPRSRTAVSAVVFVHGSGAEGRWANRFLATQLAEHGIAALIFDKRGVGRSTGDWRTATPNDLAADDVAAVEWLRKQPGIAPGRVGLHGHSQGGTLTPLVAVSSRSVAFIVASAAAGMPLDSIEVYSVLNSVLPSAATAQDSANAVAYTGELVAVAYQGRGRARLDSMVAAFRDRPWFFAPPPPNNNYWTFSRNFGQYRPLDWWRRVHVPVLLIYGADDKRVPPAESARRIRAALSEGGNRNVTVRIFPGADHTFRLRSGPSGWPVTAPGYLPTLLEWLAQR